MRFIAFLLVIAAVVVAGLLFGWVYVRDNDNSTEIIIDKQEVKQDTDEAAEATREFADEAGRKLNRLGDKVEKSLDKAVQTEEEQDSPRSEPGKLRTDSDETGSKTTSESRDDGPPRKNLPPEAARQP